MPPSSGKTTLEVLIERIDWIKTSVEKLVDEQQELRNEIREDLVNVGDLEMIRANYIAADTRESATREHEIQELRKAIAEVKQLAESIKENYVSWYMMKWIGVVALLVLAIVAGVNRDAIFGWFAKKLIP
jgi:predicted RNase H-like nuclease (RuvC/YqgF family)